MRCVCLLVLSLLFWTVVGLFAGPSPLVLAGAPGGGASAFHPAAGDAEKTLDRVLRLSEKDANLLDFVRRTPDYKPKADKGYVRYFTKRFLDAMAAMEKKAVRENCQGKYSDGEICGLDYNPLTCAQDRADNAYRYATDASSEEGMASVRYTWPGSKKPLAAFGMVQEGGQWKIDSVRCQ